MKTTLAAIKHLQGLLRKHFGKSAKSPCGEGTIFIGADKIDMTNLHGTIVARGPVGIATVLRRKRRVK